MTTTCASAVRIIASDDWARSSETLWDNSFHVRVPLVKHGFNFGSQRQRGHSWVIVRDDVASRPIDNKFREIPRNLLDYVILRVIESFRVMSEEPIGLTGIWSIDLSFLKKREISLEATSYELFDVCIGSWLLADELIAGKCKYFESFVSILLVQLHKLRIDTLGERSFRCDIDYHYTLAAICYYS